MDMKFLLSLALLASCITFSWAQPGENQYTDKSDAASISILKRVHNKYSAYKSMQMDITMTMKSGDLQEEQSATITVKDKKFKMIGRDQEMISDGTTMWNHNKLNKEVYVSLFDEEEMGLLNSPDKLLKTFEKDFISALVATVNEGGRAVYKIEFKPRSRSAEYSKVRVTIDKSTSQIKRIKIFDKSNTHYSIDIKNVKPNVSVSDASFVKDLKNLPKGTNVIDLR